MGHVKSESFDTDGGIYLYTKDNPKNPHNVRERLGGPFKSHDHATAISKETSKKVGHGSREEYKQYIKGRLRSKDKRK